MKKLLSICCATFIIFIASACGAKEQTVIMVLPQDGSNMEYVFEAKGDDIYTITQTISADCTGFTEEQIKMTIDSYDGVYDDIKSITNSTTTNEGNTIIHSFTMDVSTGEAIEELNELQFLPLDKPSSKISLEKTIAALEEQGWIQK